MKHITNPIQRRKIAIGMPLAVGLGVSLYVFATYIPNYPKIPQAWVSSGIEYAGTDSLAAFETDEGDVLLAATSKTGQRIDIFDAANGKYLRSIRDDSFVRPNGIAAARVPIQSRDLMKRSMTGEDDYLAGSSDNLEIESPLDKSILLLIVVDYEAPGKFIFDANTSRLLAHTDNQLGHPYGIATIDDGDSLQLFITDAGRAPNEVVTRFRISAYASTSEELLRRNDKSSPLNISIHIDRLDSFGDDGAGRIGKPESIVVDAARERIYLCDEDRSARNVKVYDLNGRFTETTFGDGIINGDPEGIAIVNDRSAGDFILVTDQRRRITTWHAFDADSLKYLASFSGAPRITNTDGICIYENELSGFKGGALFAVNDDADIRAYHLSDIRNLINKARYQNPN